MSKISIIFLFAFLILTISISLFAQTNVKNTSRKTTKCLVELKVTFLKRNKDTRRISLTSNSCKDKPELQELAIKEANKIELDIKIAKGEFTAITKRLEYEFEISDRGKVKIIEIKENLLILDKPKAVFPESYCGSISMKGTVRLLVLFLSDGKIGQIKLIKGLPYGANRNAIKAAKKMRFSPMKRNGIPISIGKIVAYRFDERECH